MAFYEWDQNNSGGSFVVDDKLCHIVIIEADTLDEAEQKAFDMGVYYNGCSDGIDCDCCGDRWDQPYEEVKLPADYSENTYGEGKNFLKVTGRVEIILDTIEVYAQRKADKWGWTTPDVRIYYKNGEVKEVFIQSR